MTHGDFVASINRMAREAQEAQTQSFDPRADRMFEAMEIMRTAPRMVQDVKQLPEMVESESLRLAVEDWKPDTGSLILLGPTAPGKTCAAALALWRALEHGVMVGGPAWNAVRYSRWQNAQRLTRAYQDSKLGSEPEALGESARASILVLDDLGWDVSVDSIADVLNRRYESCRHSIITSGLTRDELTERYGDAVCRRMFESGGKPATVVEFDEATQTFRVDRGTT